MAKGSIAAILLNVIEFGANVLLVTEPYETLHCVPFGSPDSTNSVYGTVVDEVVLDDVVVEVELTELLVLEAYANEALAAYITTAIAIANIARAPSAYAPGTPFPCSCMGFIRTSFDFKSL
jgi:hypothetical protein